MSEETLAVVEQAETTSDFDDSYAEALAEVSGGKEPEVSASEDTPTAPVEGKADPEWVAWAKSVNGNTDASGNINTDAVLRQAYELNRQNQAQAQQIAQVRQLLQDPKIYEAVRTAIQGQAKPPEKTDGKQEKTDEEVFKELVLGAVQDEFKKFIPVQQQVAQLYQNHLYSVKDQVYSQLESEYSGDVQFSQLDPILGQVIAQEASQFQMHPSAYIDLLASRGQLYPKLKFISDAVSFQFLKNKPKEQPQAPAPTPAPVEQRVAKNAQLSRPGTPVQQVKQADGSIEDLEDAWANAKRELQQKR